jgi:hypothetical protein
MKQETLEELAKDFYSDENQLMERIAFKRGYTECKENSYSEEEVYDILFKHTEYFLGGGERMSLTQWFEQFKKK